jgi:amino acid adenylation domain-containing protein
VVQLFEEQVAATPYKTAVIHQHEIWTYEQLNQAANCVAGVLRQSFGVRAEQLIGVMLERSHWMIAILLGIIKAGGAYLPIDPDYPSDRVEYILSDSQCRLLISTDELRSRVSGFKGEILDLDRLQNSTTYYKNPETVNCPDDMIYVIYTSGTTGRPKGCILTHRNVVRLLKNNHFPYDFNEQDVWIMAHSFCFDFSVWEMYGALLYGGTLVVPRRDDVRDVSVFLNLIKKYKISVLNQTPGAFYRLVEEEALYPEKTLAEHLRYVIFGGDRLEPVNLRNWSDMYALDKVRLVNMYGITETTVHVTHYTLTDDDIQSQAQCSPIGVPIPETTCYILDRQMQPVPVGVVGELYVGGSGVARGYLNRPDLSCERFIPHPFYPGERLYRSGDLGKWWPNGSIEYLGRIDQQVKIRGFRIELGEIESRLLQYPGIQKTVVTVREESPGDRSLCAYIVSSEVWQVKDIREFLAVRLPEYMIPAYFVALERIPLTVNGKVDRKALPAPNINAGGREFVAPHDGLEHKVADIWAKVLMLDREKIGVTSNFFELGGHSLKAMTIVAQIHRELQVHVPLVEMFKRPTVRELAEYVQRSAPVKYSSIPVAPRREHYVLTSSQKRLYALQQIEPDSITYNISLAVYIPSDWNEIEIASIFRRLIGRHESLRTSFFMFDGRIVQRILDDVPFSLEFFDVKLVQYTAEQQQVAIATLIRDFVRPFDLGQAPLLRVGLIRTAGERNILLVDMHHIISDRRSHEVLLSDFLRLYSGEELPPLRLQYKDYAEWLSTPDYSRELQRQEEYWLRLFSGTIPRLNLPLDFRRGEAPESAGAVILFQVEKADLAALRALAKDREVTLQMLLSAVFFILLAKISNQDDIIIGTPVAGRYHAELESIVGAFINTLLLRASPQPEKTFMQFLMEVRDISLGAYENQAYAFEELAARTMRSRENGRLPLFDILFEIHAWNGQTFTEGEESAISYFNMEQTSTKAPMDWIARESKDRLSFYVSYSTALFLPETIQVLIEKYKLLLSCILKNPEAAIHDLNNSLTVSVPASSGSTIEFDF